MERDPDPTACYQPRTFEPPTPELSFARPAGRRLAQQRSSGRIRESLQATLAVQTDPSLSNYGRRFFLTYINSFNEWHEGHAFEPMRDYLELSPVEKALNYHNTYDGKFRLKVLSQELTPLLAPSSGAY